MKMEMIIDSLLKGKKIIETIYYKVLNKKFKQMMMN